MLRVDSERQWSVVPTYTTAERYWEMPKSSSTLRFGSFHPDTVNFVRCDGSVAFVDRGNPRLADSILTMFFLTLNCKRHII